MDDEILNDSEKKEISMDVKDAFDKASGGNRKIFKNKRSIVVSIFIIVSLFLSGLYVFFSNNPKDVFVMGVNYSFDAIKSNISTPSYNVGKGTINYKDNEISFVKDYKNNVIRANINNTNDIYIKDGKIYLFLDDNIYYIGDDNNYLSYNPSVFVKILNIYKDALIFASSNQKVIGSKSNDGYVVTLNINDDVRNYMISYLSDNDELKSLYSELNIDLSDVPNRIVSSVNMLDGDFKIFTEGTGYNVFKVSIGGYTITKSNDSLFIIQGKYNGSIDFSSGIVFRDINDNTIFKYEEVNGNKIEDISIIEAGELDYNIDDLFNK